MSPYRSALFVGILTLGFFAPGAREVFASGEAGKKNPGISRKAVEDILRYSDRSRGYISTGVRYPFEVTITDEYGATATRKYDLDSYGDRCQAVQTHPPTRERRTIVVNNDFVWILRGTGQRPTPVSVQERLTGLASIGDIMANYFSRGYKVKEFAAEEKTVKVTLESGSRVAAYKEVKAEFDLTSKLLTRAVFFAPGGSALKTIVLTHGSNVTIGKETFPFISRMDFFDGGEAKGNPAAVVNFGQLTETDLKADYFELESVMKRLKVAP